MKMVHWFGMLAIVLMLGGFVAVPQAVYAQEAIVEPTVGSPGTEFTFFLAGFSPGEQVGVWLNNPDGTVSDILDEDDDIFLLFADGEGLASFSLVIASDSPSGFYQMVAFGVDSEVELVVPFEIRSDAPADAPVPTNFAVEPPAGPSGTEFVFAAEGFEPNEQIGIWTNNADGTVSEILDENGEVFTPFADEDGLALWSVFVEDVPGFYEMVAVGVDSGVQVVIPFEITP